MKILKVLFFILLFCGAIGIKGQDADAKGCGAGSACGETTGTTQETTGEKGGC